MPDRRAELVQQMIAEGTSDEDIRATLRVIDAQTAPPATATPERTWGDTALDVGKGIMKGAGATVAGLGEMAANAGVLPGVRPSAFNADMRNPAFTKAEESTTATNTPQRVGKVLETGAEMALPILKGASAIPRAGRAAAKFENIMSLAKDVPLDMRGPGNAALRTAELASHGGGTELGPGPVRQFIRYATDPSKPPMTYKVGQDFMSNISRLSADEAQKLTPVLKREVGQLSAALRQSLTDAAETVGKGGDYTDAVTEYAKAMGLRDLGKDAAKMAVKALPYMGGGGAGYLLYKHLLGGS